MRDFRFPELSPTAGELNDGVVRGRIERSLVETGQAKVAFVSGITAFRKDTSPTGVITYVDVSAEMVSDTANSFLPWGDTSSFSVGDELWVAGDADICELYPEVDVAGVWAGDGLEIFESLDGETLTAVTGLVDNSDGFRVAGGNLIEFDVGARKLIAPQFGTPKKKYIVIRPKNITAVTTAPQLRRMRASCSEVELGWVDVTSFYNGDPTDGTFPPLGDIFVTLNSHAVLGFKGIAGAYIQYIHQALEPVAIRTHDYFDGTNWQPLLGVVDASAGSTNGPVTLGDGMQEFMTSWPIPSNWPKVAMTFGSTTYTAHWLRVRPSSILEYRPSKPTLGRVRSLSYGPGLAVGLYHNAAKTWLGCDYQMPIASATDIVFELVSATTGAAVSVTIPSGETTGHVLFGSPFGLPAQAEVLVKVLSGNATDVAINLID